MARSTKIEKPNKYLVTSIFCISFCCRASLFRLIADSGGRLKQEPYFMTEDSNNKSPGIAFCSIIPATLACAAAIRIVTRATHEITDPTPRLGETRRDTQIYPRFRVRNEAVYLYSLSIVYLFFIRFGDDRITLSPCICETKIDTRW